MTDSNHYKIEVSDHFIEPHYFKDVDDPEFKYGYEYIVPDKLRARYEVALAEYQKIDEELGELMQIQSVAARKRSKKRREAHDSVAEISW